LVGGSNFLYQDSRYTYQSFNNEIFNEFGIEVVPPFAVRSQSVKIPAEL